MMDAQSIREAVFEVPEEIDRLLNELEAVEAALRVLGDKIDCLKNEGKGLYRGIGSFIAVLNHLDPESKPAGQELEEVEICRKVLQGKLRALEEKEEIWDREKWPELVQLQLEAAELEKRQHDLLVEIEVRLHRGY